MSSIEKTLLWQEKALFLIGEIRICFDLNAEEGATRLQKVLELNDKDIIAAQAESFSKKNSI
jgi:hypothetical protein